MAMGQRMPLRVLLGGHAPSLERALRDLLFTGQEFDVVAAAVAADQVIALAAALSPDVIVLNFRVHGLGGLETVRRLRAAAPQSHVLMLGDDDDDVYAAAARGSGASAYLSCQTAGQTLRPALRALAGGRSPGMPVARAAEPSYPDRRWHDHHG